MSCPYNVGVSQDCILFLILITVTIFISIYSNFVNSFFSNTRSISFKFNSILYASCNASHSIKFPHKDNKNNQSRKGLANTFIENLVKLVLQWQDFLAWASVSALRYDASTHLHYAPAIIYQTSAITSFPLFLSNLIGILSEMNWNLSSIFSAPMAGLNEILIFSNLKSVEHTGPHFETSNMVRL